ncbi:hypothetical protein B0H14DRAFT_2587013 [Mycena olivaceomarginata]|nr:hypothetical protein B0H14DRAFT_2587013 [Mycena olivaceomarginata]
MPAGVACEGRCGWGDAYGVASTAVRVWVYVGWDAGAGAWRSRWSMGSGAREHAGAAYAVYRSGYGDKCTHTCWHTMREVPGGRSERGSGGYAGVHTAAQVGVCSEGGGGQGTWMWMATMRGRQRAGVIKRGARSTYSGWPVVCGFQTEWGDTGSAAEAGRVQAAERKPNVEYEARDTQEHDRAALCAKVCACADEQDAGASGAAHDSTKKKKNRTSEINRVQSSPFQLHRLRTEWQFSRKKAFLLGIKATDLDGTHQDVQRFRTLLVDKFGFQSGDIIMILDNGVDTQPTKVNIVRAEQNA